jgi:hypothetical protein
LSVATVRRERRHVDPAALGPAFESRFGELHALRAGDEVPRERRAVEQVADEELPLDLERVVVGRVRRHALPGVVEVDRLRHVGFHTGLGVAARGWIRHSVSPATAEPSVPSTWNVARSSRRTRVHHELLTCATIVPCFAPPSSSNGRVRRVIRSGVVRLAALVPALRDVRRAEARHRLDLAEQVVEHVAPVAQHVDDDPAVVLLAVVPRRALRGLPVALEHPVAELAAHRQDAAEEAAVDEHLQLQEAREPQLVLDHAVLDARGLRALREVDRVGERRRDRLLGVDVLARGDRLADELGAQPRRRRVEVERVVRVAQRRVEVGRDARHAVRLRERLELWRLRPTRIGSGMTRRPSASATPPCARIAQIERTRCWFVPMRPGDAVHDDAEANGAHFDSTDVDGAAARARGGGAPPGSAAR